MTKNCEKSQVTQKIVRLTNFRNFRKFCQIDNSLWTSVIINITKNCEKLQLVRKIVRLAIFRVLRKIASLTIFAATCKPGHKWQYIRVNFTTISVTGSHCPYPQNEVIHTFQADSDNLTATGTVF